MVTYNICYDVASFVMLFVIIILFLIRREVLNYQNRLFLMLILCAFFGTMADIIELSFISAGSSIPIWMKYISSGACFVIQSMEALLVLFYFLGITNSWWKIKKTCKNCISSSLCYYCFSCRNIVLNTSYILL